MCGSLNPPPPPRPDDHGPNPEIHHYNRTLHVNDVVYPDDHTLLAKPIRGSEWPWNEHRTADDIFFRTKAN